MASLKAKRRFGGNQRLEITGLAEGPPFQVEVLDGLQVDPTVPAICRWSKSEPGMLEIGYLDDDTGDLSGTVVRARRLA